MNEPLREPSNQNEDSAAKKRLRSIAVRGKGSPLDPNNNGTFIKPGELIDAIEVTPQTRNRIVLHNMLLANAWPDIATQSVYRVRKSVLRGSHNSNERLMEDFIGLMSDIVTIRYKSKDGSYKVERTQMLGSNVEEEEEDGVYNYTLFSLIFKY